MGLSGCNSARLSKCAKYCPIGCLPVLCNRTRGMQVHVNVCHSLVITKESYVLCSERNTNSVLRAGSFNTLAFLVSKKVKAAFKKHDG